MSHSRELLLDEDVESSLGRSSSDGSINECDIIDQKQPLIQLRSRSDSQSEECPICQRRQRWRTFLSVLRFKGKGRARCPHDKRIIEEYLRSSHFAPARKRAKSRRCRMIATFVLIVFATFGVWNLVTLFIGLGPLIWDPSIAVDHFFPNWGLPGEPGEGLTGYPTDFTRDVTPIPCHSHNDYWRRVPLYEAIHYGCTGVEADVWLFDEDLYVGHIVASLTKNRTFRSLYVDPLVRILDSMNPEVTLDSSGQVQPIRGVFEEAPSQTLVLLVDFKMDGQQQFPVVSAQLEGLRSRNYLTYFDGEKVVDGPITVVATGNAPFDVLTANSTYRDIFFDAPLDQLVESNPSPSQNPSHKSQHPATHDLSFSSSSSPVPPAPNTPSATDGQGNTGTNPLLGASQFSRENSYYASINFKQTIGFPYRGHLSTQQRHKLRTQIKAAKDKDLKARYWNTPNWPVGLRNHVWKILVEEGADVLNVDDLRSAKMVDWRKSWKGRSWWGGGI